MKLLLNHFKCLGLLVGLLGVNLLQAQTDSSYFTVSGVVKSKLNNKKLDGVGVFIVGSNVSTVTNADGEFLLKVEKSAKGSEVEFFHLGYDNLRVPVKSGDKLESTYYLTPSKAILLKEAQVNTWEYPVQLVRAALSKIDKNYSTTPTLLTGFYRETIKKRRSYISISEAVVNIQKTSYSLAANRDRVFIYKGRKLLSQSKNDTLAVKLAGGPSQAVYMDVVKNLDVLFSMDELYDYKFTMGSSAMFDDRMQYVVNFEPQSILPYPLLYGKMYIDQQSLAVTRVEASLDMKHREKVTSLILKKKPAGLRFKPEEVSFTVVYKQHGDKTHLSYIRNDMKFQCDWKRKLFATNYSIVSEMVVTDSKPYTKADVAGEKPFGDREILSEKVSSFYDEDFWGAYNIIEPTESLESAVKKLKKQQK